VLRFVVFMLLVPVDTSEAERIFSLMNDIKTYARTRLQQQNLNAMMVWNYYGNKLEPWQVPVHEILKEFHALANNPTQGRNKHI
jgi:hypothetical protein